MKRKKVSPTGFASRIHARLRKILEKGAIKNEKYTIQQITIRRKLYEQSSDTIKR